MSNVNNNSNQPTGALNNLNGIVEYSKIKGNVGPYVRSRVWANRVARAAASNTNNRQAMINLANKRPTLKMVKMALAQALGVRYTTTGRGGGLEDAPFIPGVSALPTIQRNVWSTEESHLPVDEIRRRMDGHWGIDGISDNIARNPLNMRNARPRRETLINGAISSFYHPAFTQVCYGNGEWLINGFKVQKGAAVETAARVLGRNAATIEFDPRGPSNQQFLIGSGSKGTIAAEADILKITILNWPRSNSNNYSRTRIIFTVGEDKVGPGESAQAHGKEVAQLRFIMFAIYYMWHALHQAGAEAHPWSKIPVENIKLEAVFLAAGAGTVQNTKISNQAAAEKTGILAPRANFSQKTVINIVPINLDKFCAIFRLDPYRFAEAMTAVDKKFRSKMIEYFQNISRLNSDPRGNTRVNNTTRINVSAGLATTKLNNRTLARPFRPTVLRAPRTNWANNQNRKNLEVYWLEKYNSAPGATYRRSINNALAAFGKPRGSNTSRNNVASYYSGASNVEALTRVKQTANRSANTGEAISREQEAEAARLAATKAARAAALEAGAPRMVGTAFRNVAALEAEIKSAKRTNTQKYANAVSKLKAAQNVLNIYRSLQGQEPSSIINGVLSGNFEQKYRKFLSEHTSYGPYLRNAFTQAIQAKKMTMPEQANVWNDLLNQKALINNPPKAPAKKKVAASPKK